LIMCHFFQVVNVSYTISSDQYQKKVFSKFRHLAKLTVFVVLVLPSHK